MLKSFFSGVSDQVTPKASDANKNPFESLTFPSNPSSRKNSVSIPSGLRTPTPKSPISPGGSLGEVTPGGATTGGLVPSSGIQPSGGALPTVAISKGEPDFTFKTNPAALARKRDSNSSPKGKLYVKLIQARGLATSNPESRPYVVAAFDQNEFISRAPILEGDPELTSLPNPALLPNGSGRTSSPPAHTPKHAKPPEGNGNANPNGNAGLGVSPSGLTRSLEAYKKDNSNQSSLSAPTSELPIALAVSNPVWKHEVIFDVANDQSRLYVSVYDRAFEEQPFLGHVEIRPKLLHGIVMDEWFKLKPREGEHVAGDVRVQLRYEKTEGKKLSPSDFRFLRMIGKGTFGRVFQVRKKDTERIYAMKVLSKREIVAKKEVAHTIGERKILQRSSDCPFLLGLKFSFQTKTDLYLVMDFKSGGELFHHLQREGRFTEERARFYAAEIVLAFDHLHKFDIVYRDLKPENILLDATGHLVLCDFGLSKPDLPSDALTNTFCGTTEYLAPEVLLDDHGYSKLVDFWSLGVLLFEMCCGWSPFYAEDTQTMYKNICFGKIKFPRGVIGDDGKQFVKGLLNRNPKHRLGSKGDAAELKQHGFFKLVDWNLLFARKVTPPFKPLVDSDDSVANFDAEFTEANVMREAPAAAFDDNDPSADWLQHASLSNEPNFPHGSVPVPIRVDSNKEGRSKHSSSPLTSSMQENFRGFSFAGDSVTDRPDLDKLDEPFRTQT